jgi:hypothetical protein
MAHRAKHIAIHEFVLAMTELRGLKDWPNNFGEEIYRRG